MNQPFKNTYRFGKLTYLVLKEGRHYTGVCLEFDLVMQAPTSEEAKEHIEDLAKGWYRNVITNKLPEEILNKRAPEKYWVIAEKIEKIIRDRKITKKERDPSPVVKYQEQKYFEPAMA